MEALGWKVEKIGKWQAFIKRFPIFGSLIKIQRIIPPIPFEEIEKLAKKHRAFKIVVEFDKSPKSLKLPSTYRIYKSPFLPTKTIIIDLKRTEQEIFKSFTPEKRRAIRKAEKNGIVVEKVNNPQIFVSLKQKSLLEKLIVPIGSKKEIVSLWNAFAPKQAKIIMAYCQNKPTAGVFLLFHEKMSYYWLAASIKKGKKLFAPTLLVWEALKLSKKLGCTEFDFEGIYDKRFPISSWKGFTKFKQGFGGKETFFPEPIRLTPRFT